MVSTTPTTALQEFVMDVLRHDDIESVSSIVRLLNDRGCIGWRDHWPRDFTGTEVALALRELISSGFVEALREAEETDDLLALADDELDFTENHQRLWFALTKRGHDAWEAWQPPAAPSDGQERGAAE
jgi:hypothetical protein